MNFALRINRTWLQNAVYPIFIDPSLSINNQNVVLGGNLIYDTVYVGNNGTISVNSSIGYLFITAKTFTLLGTINGESSSNNTGGLNGGTAGAFNGDTERGISYALATSPQGPFEFLDANDEQMVGYIPLQLWKQSNFYMMIAYNVNNGWGPEIFYTRDFRHWRYLGDMLDATETWEQSSLKDGRLMIDGDMRYLFYSAGTWSPNGSQGTYPVQIGMASSPTDRYNAIVSMDSTLYYSSNAISTLYASVTLDALSEFNGDIDCALYARITHDILSNFIVTVSSIQNYNVEINYNIVSYLNDLSYMSTNANIELSANVNSSIESIMNALSEISMFSNLSIEASAVANYFSEIGLDSAIEGYISSFYDAISSIEGVLVSNGEMSSIRDTTVSINAGMEVGSNESTIADLLTSIGIDISSDGIIDAIVGKISSFDNEISINSSIVSRLNTDASIILETISELIASPQDVINYSSSVSMNTAVSILATVERVLKRSIDSSLIRRPASSILSREPSSDSISRRP